MAALRLSASLSIGALARLAFSESICRPGDWAEGDCAIDGTGCDGEEVVFDPYIMNVSTWDATAKKASLAGTITSYAIKGSMDTWQMYLHGPLVHPRERAEGDTTIPNLYVFGTFVNKIYKFENFTMPSLQPGEAPKPITAIQKMVGHALAPSTGVIIQDSKQTLADGLMVAEGQPFLFSNVDTIPAKEMYFGGVEYLPFGHTKNCTQIFPDKEFDVVSYDRGQVVNTVDCHTGTGICFFSVWQFTDDQAPVWAIAEKMAGNDCLYYCILAPGGLDDAARPQCLQTAPLQYEDGSPICHAQGVGAVHGFTIGNTDKTDPNKFDLLLVFTGKSAMSNGESSMKKLNMQVVGSLDGMRQVVTLKSQPFAEDLFQSFAPEGFDVGGDHAWVDETGEYVWISCFRQKGVGAHMVKYETGDLVYSVTGLDTYVPNQYTYTAGIHGVGTVGKKGSYLVIATCSCHDVKVCIPTVPWHWPVPKDVWSIGVLFVVDLSTMSLKTMTAPSVDAILV